MDKKKPDIQKTLYYYHQALDLGEKGAQEKIEWLQKHIQN